MGQAAMFPNRPTRALVARAQAALGMTHREFGEALGSSERTALRWAAGRSSVGVSGLRALARLVHPRDPALANELAGATSETLESLGIVAQGAAVAADASVLVDAVVCAAADALSMAPSAVRGALLAAFGRARELGLSVGDVEKAIAARVGKGKGKGSAQPSGASQKP